MFNFQFPVILVFKFVLTKSFSQNVCIWPDAEDITASIGWKTLHVLSVIWILSVLEKLRSCCLIEASQSSTYCLAKDISKLLNICIITQSYWLFEVVTGYHIKIFSSTVWIMITMWTTWNFRDCKYLHADGLFPLHVTNISCILSQILVYTINGTCVVYLL